MFAVIRDDFLFIAAIQINVELRNSSGLKRVQFLYMLFWFAKDTKLFHDIIRDETQIRVVALAMFRMIISTAVLDIRC